MCCCSRHLSLLQRQQPLRQRPTHLRNIRYCEYCTCTHGIITSAIASTHATAGNTPKCVALVNIHASSAKLCRLLVLRKSESHTDPHRAVCVRAPLCGTVAGPRKPPSAHSTKAPRATRCFCLSSIVSMATTKSANAPANVLNTVDALASGSETRPHPHHTPTHTHASHTPTHPHPHTSLHTPTYTHLHPYTPLHTPTHPHSHTIAYTHPHTQAPTHPHTTHTQAHIHHRISHFFVLRWVVRCRC